MEIDSEGVGIEKIEIEADGMIYCSKDVLCPSNYPDIARSGSNSTGNAGSTGNTGSSSGTSGSSNNSAKCDKSNDKKGLDQDHTVKYNEFLATLQTSGTYTSGGRGVRISIDRICAGISLSDQEGAGGYCLVLSYNVIRIRFNPNLTMCVLPMCLTV